MRRLAIALLSLVSLAHPLLASDTVPPAQAPMHQTQVLSKVYTIDRIYKSMEGPWDVQTVFLGDKSASELVWVTAVRTEIVGEDGKTPQPSQFMCHMNLDLDSFKHQALFRFQRPQATRVVTLSQGVFATKLPDGFGYPMLSDEPLHVFTQVLNHNIPNPKNVKVRHLVTIEYLRDSELSTPIKPLFNLGAAGMVLLDEKLPSLVPDSKPADRGIAVESSAHGPSCLMLPRAPNGSTNSDYIDPEGHKLTGHWVVPPGRQVNHSDVTWFMNLPYDTRLHYASVHLHPFAKSFAFRDSTTGQTIWTANATGPKKGIGLTKVDTFSSIEGVPLYKDHKYEVISIYDNPMKVNSDSMASIFFGLEDPEFQRPGRAELAARAADLDDRDWAIIRTTAGDMRVNLYRGQAPNAVRQFVRLVRGRVFENGRVGKVDPQTAFEIRFPSPAGDLQQLASPIVAEPVVNHWKGTLSVCPDTNLSSFAIVLGSGEERNRRCTAFGLISAGEDVLGQIAEAPLDADGNLVTPIEVTKIELFENGEIDAIALAPSKPLPVVAK